MTLSQKSYFVIMWIFYLSLTIQALYRKMTIFAKQTDCSKSAGVDYGRCT